MAHTSGTTIETPDGSEQDGRYLHVERNYTESTVTVTLGFPHTEDPEQNEEREFTTDMTTWDEATGVAHWQRVAAMASGH